MVTNTVVSGVGGGGGDGDGGGGGEGRFHAGMAFKGDTPPVTLYFIKFMALL